MPVLLITHYPCKLTVLYFLYYIPCTRARFYKNELGGSGGRTGGVDRRKSDTTFFVLLQLNFWSTPLPGIRDFDDLFCFNSVFGAPLCLGSEISTTFFCSNSVFGAPLCPGPDISTTFFCFNSVFGAPLCPLTRDFDDLFQNFFSQQALHTARAVAAPEPRSFFYRAFSICFNTAYTQLAPVVLSTTGFIY